MKSVKDSDQIFSVKFSSEYLQIWCMDSLYHANQYVGNNMFIYIYFLHLGHGFIVSDYSICWCLQADIFYNILFITVFTYRNVACEKC